MLTFVIMYKFLIKPIFFAMQPEKAHYFATDLLTFFSKIPGIPSLMKEIFEVKDKRLEKKLFGLTFKNPVGLAAGFDKDARWYNGNVRPNFSLLEKKRSWGC